MKRYIKCSDSPNRTNIKLPGIGPSLTDLIDPADIEYYASIVDDVYNRGYKIKYVPSYSNRGFNSSVDVNAIVYVPADVCRTKDDSESIKNELRELFRNHDWATLWTRAGKDSNGWIRFKNTY